MMAYSTLGGVPGSLAADARMGDEGSAAPRPLPADAQHTLDQIADALGVTTALLQPRGVSNPGKDVRLGEATELLQAFIRIQDPEVRRRCVAFVQEAAGAAPSL